MSKIHGILNTRSYAVCWLKLNILERKTIGGFAHSRPRSSRLFPGFRPCHDRRLPLSRTAAEKSQIKKDKKRRVLYRWSDSSAKCNMLFGQLFQKQNWIDRQEELTLREGATTARARTKWSVVFSFVFFTCSHFFFPFFRPPPFTLIVYVRKQKTAAGYLAGVQFHYLSWVEPESFSDPDSHACFTLGSCADVFGLVTRSSWGKNAWQTQRRLHRRLATFLSRHAIFPRVS